MAMKVVCESCQAKYQVPDERVAGKKLKIRCKRCGATVLIRGDLAQSGLPDGIQSGLSGQSGVDASELAQAAPAAELEWHASIEGQSYGPFDTSTLLRWLDAQPGGWDAHVWRDGFADWVEVRACPELMAAAPAGAGMGEEPFPATDPGMDAPEVPGVDEEEGPTRTFQNDDVAPARRPRTLTGTQTAEELRARASSSIRARSNPAMAAAPAAAVGSWGAAASASPRVTATQAMTGERHEDSVLFSTANLQQVAMTNTQPGYGANAAPGFASGEASGLIDIRALASLAKQSAPQIAPGAAYDRFRADDDSRMAVMNQTGAFNRVDSLAPVSTTSSTSSAAVPLAILGGFALVAAAAFAAILITRDAKQPEVASVAVVPDTAATAQPTVTPEPPPPAAAPAPAVAAPEPAAEQPAAPAVAEPESEELANGKAAKRSRSSRTASEEKKEGTIPAEKAKPKKEKESAPPSSDEVMLAAKPEKAEPEAKPEPKHEPPKHSSGNTDIDDLLGGTSKPAAKTSSKSRSIDDLLEGAPPEPTKKKEAAPASAPAASAAADEASDLPAQPARDEVLAAMRGVEGSVKACAKGDTKGVAEVQITVAGSTGRVTNATVTGITGEVGSCIARAARNAKFPRFSKPTFQLKYPYRLQ